MDIQTIEEAVNKSDLGEDCQGNRLYLEVTSEMIDWLVAEVNQWQSNFYGRCEIQLDRFHKDGMTVAARRCVELANDCTAGHEAVAAITREFKL